VGGREAGRGRVGGPGHGAADEDVQEHPELPFEDLKLRLFGGSRAPLATSDGLWHLHDDHIVDAVVGARIRSPRLTI